MPRPSISRPASRASLAFVLTVALASPLLAAGRRVVFVDNSRAGGAGTYERPLATLTEAEARSGFGDVIYVAETTTPYEGAINLKKGQMLIGSAYGLDALRADDKIEVDAPGVPASQGTGPLIHGIVSLAGDNLVAGITLLADRKSAGGINAFEPHGAIALKRVWIRTSERAFGLTVADADGPLTVTGGGLTGDGGNGVVINRGRGTVIFDRFPITGTFATAVSIWNRVAGAVTFRNLSKIDVSDAVSDAITLQNCDSPVTFESPIQLMTHGGRGIVATQMKKLVLSGGIRIDATNGSAIDFHDCGVEASFQKVSVQGVPPGRVNDGIVINKVRGHLAIVAPEGETGGAGTIRNTQRSGMTLEQSSGLRVVGLSFLDNGSGTRTKCEGDVPGKTNLLCRAAVFLRHLSDSQLEDLTIEGGGQVGINANNLSNVSMANIQIHHVGSAAWEPGILLDEFLGDVKLSRCHIEDSGGGAIQVEQSFNRGRLLLDRCTLAQSERPGAAPYLLDAAVRGEGSLAIELTNLDIHDNAASAIRLQSLDRSALTFSLTDSTVQRIGGGALEVLVRQGSHARIAVRNVQITAPGARERSLLEVQLQSAAGSKPSACVELQGNRFSLTGGGKPAIHLVSDSVGALQVVAPATSSVEATAVMLERANPGSTVVIEGMNSVSKIVQNCDSPP